MISFLGRDLSRLLVHGTLHSLAWCLCGLFSSVFLLRLGLSLAAIFLVFAAILVLRFVLRPPVIAVAILTTVLGGFYVPTLLTAVYNHAKASPFSFRFQFAAEGG